MEAIKTKGGEITIEWVEAWYQKVANPKTIGLDKHLVSDLEAATTAIGRAVRTQNAPIGNVEEFERFCDAKLAVVRELREVASRFTLGPTATNYNADPLQQALLEVSAWRLAGAEEISQGRKGKRPNKGGTAAGTGSSRVDNTHRCVLRTRRWRGLDAHNRGKRVAELSDVVLRTHGANGAEDEQGVVNRLNDDFRWKVARQEIAHLLEIGAITRTDLELTAGSMDSTSAELGERFGMSKDNVRQIKSRTLKKLRPAVNRSFEEWSGEPRDPSDTEGH